MDVYFNNVINSCASGGVLIAANSLEEAIRTWHSYEYYNNDVNDDFEKFDKLSYDCEEPCVILDNYGDW